MLRKTYDWVMGLAASRHAPRALAAVAFAEGLFFPIPPDVLLCPWCWRTGREPCVTPP